MAQDLNYILADIPYTIEEQHGNGAVPHAAPPMTNGDESGMVINSTTELLQAFLNATRPSEVEAILAALGDGEDIPVGEPFGALGLQWHFFGNNPSNMSTINLGSKAGRSLTERVTNAMDAVLEREMYARAATEEPPQSPMEAADRWFGRPPTTANEGLFKLNRKQREEYSHLVQIVMTPGDEDSKPAVDVVDAGIGIAPDAFADTILSFHRGNKISKHYLVGAFGQGGSSTVAFADYTLIISRHLDSPDIIGFTLVKLMDLEESYKENAYVYLAVGYDDGSVSVPYISDSEPLDLYPCVKQSKVKPQPFTVGTAVRHYGYQLEGLERPLSTSPRNLYHLFNYMLFDPLLPFGVVDLRVPDQYSREVVIGSRNRLMRGEEGVEIRHHQPRFWIRPQSGEEQTLAIEYWVVFAARDTNGNGNGNGKQAAQRARPHDLFLDHAHPIVGSLNGQNHGELTGRIIKEAKLPQVAKHLIVHFDMTHVSKRVRSQLLSSTREGFKDGEVLNEVIRLLKDHFRDDEALHEIETELEQSLLNNDGDHASEEVRKRITTLLKDIGLDFSEATDLPLTGGEIDDPEKLPGAKRTASRKTPLPTLPYPQVTRFEIVKPQDILRIHQNDSRLIRVETNANIHFDRLGALQIQIAPNNLVDVSKSTLIGGRVNWRLRPRREAKAGDTGKIVVSLMLPNGRVMESRLPYEVLPPRAEKIRTPRGFVPAFDVQGLDPFENYKQFFRVWDYLTPGEDDLTAVAYKTVETSTGIIIYYSKAFAEYRKRFDQIMHGRPALAAQFVQNYEIWIGYYALLQWQQRALNGSAASDIHVAEEVLERIQDNESALVAEMQAKQALEVADLQRRMASVTEAEGE